MRGRWVHSPVDPALPAPVVNPGLSDKRAPSRCGDEGGGWGTEGLGKDS